MEIVPHQNQEDVPQASNSTSLLDNNSPPLITITDLFPDTARSRKRRKPRKEIPSDFTPLPNHPTICYLLPGIKKGRPWGAVYDVARQSYVLDWCPEVLSARSIEQLEGPPLTIYRVQIRRREYELESDKLGLESGWHHVREPGVEQPSDRRLLGDIIRHQWRDKSVTQVVTHSGWHIIDGRRLYVDLDGQVYVFDGQEPPLLQLDLGDRSDLKEAVSQQPPEVTDSQVRFYLLTLLDLGGTIQAPLIAVALDARGRGHFFRRAECSVYFEAPPGAGKTSCAAFARQMSLDCSYEPVPSVSFRSTATGMELQSLHEADRLILIDNLSVSRSAVAARTTQQADFIDRFVQSVVDGSSLYVRGNRYLRIRRGTVAGGPALFTGEVLPPGISGGTKRRMLRVKWPDGALASTSELTDPNGPWQSTYRRGWGSAREIGRRVVRFLSELKDPAKCLADLDQWGASRMEAALRIPGVPKAASKLFCRAGVILAGARILEIVCDLDPDTLVGPLVEALKKHVVEWAEELDAGEYTPVTQGDEVASLIKAALVNGHLHVRDSSGEVPKETGLWNGLMPPERGARISNNGDIDVRGAPTYWLDPPKVAKPALGIKTADLYHILRSHPTLGTVPERLLPTRLVELGYALESRNENLRGVQRIPIGSGSGRALLWLVLIRRDRVFPDSGSPEDGEEPQPSTAPPSDPQSNSELESTHGRQQDPSLVDTVAFESEEVPERAQEPVLEFPTLVPSAPKDLDRICVLGRKGRLLGPDGSVLGQFSLGEAVRVVNEAHQRRELFGLYVSGEAAAELAIHELEIDGQPHPKLRETGLDFKFSEYGGRVYLPDGITVHFPSLDGNSPWQSIDSAEELLRLLQEFRCRVGISWQGSSAETARQLLLHASPQIKIDDGTQPPPPTMEHKTFPGRPAWVRPPTEEERSLPYLVPYDQNRAYLSAENQVILGLGQHRLLKGTEAEALAAESRKRAGLFEIRLCCNYEPWELPERRLISGDWVWVTAATLEYLQKSSIPYELRQAYGYERSSRYLRTVAERIEQALKQVSPGPLQHAIKSLYSPMAGVAAANRLQDTPTNPTYRPDWRDMIVSLANVNLWRHLDRVRAHCGRWPIAVNIDAVAYAAASDNHEKAAEELGLTLSPQLGKFKAEGRIVPMEEFLALPEPVKNNALFGRDGIFKTEEH